LILGRYTGQQRCKDFDDPLDLEKIQALMDQPEQITVKEFVANKQAVQPVKKPGPTKKRSSGTNQAVTELDADDVQAFVAETFVLDKNIKGTDCLTKSKIRDMYQDYLTVKNPNAGKVQFSKLVSTLKELFPTAMRAEKFMFRLKSEAAAMADSDDEDEDEEEDEATKKMFASDGDDDDDDSRLLEKTALDIADEKSASMTEDDSDFDSDDGDDDNDDDDDDDGDTSDKQSDADNSDSDSINGLLTSLGKMEAKNAAAAAAPKINAVPMVQPKRKFQFGGDDDDDDDGTEPPAKTVAIATTSN